MSDDSGNEMCYVGRAPCGCYLYAAVIGAYEPKEVAKEIAKLLRNGFQ